MSPGMSFMWDCQLFDSYLRAGLAGCGICYNSVVALSGVVPGIGSILNMIFIGLFVDLIDHIGIINTPDSIFGRVLMLLSAIIIMDLQPISICGLNLEPAPGMA